MFLKLLSIEWTRLSRRALLWVFAVSCILYTYMSLTNFYQLAQTDLLDGTLKMPGMSFDLANALDQLSILIPFLVILAANLIGNDYSQRMNQHWLMRAPRHTGLLAKFVLLAIIILIFQIITLLIGWSVGFYFKTFVYHVPNVNNLNWLAVLAAPFYMTLVSLPFAALTLLLGVGLRSTFFSVALSLGYTQFFENLCDAIFYEQSWTGWLINNVHLSATFLLNSIGARAVKVPDHLLEPIPAIMIAMLYTLLFLALAAWLYRRQDVGG